MSSPADIPAHTPPPPDAEPRKKRKATGRMECQLGLLLGMGGLVGSRLGHLWIAFDVFSQFTLQFALVTFAFVIGLLMPRGKLLAAFLVIIAGLVAIGMWPHVASRAPLALATAGPNERVLHVVSYNSLYTNDDADAVKAEVLRLDADVVGLVEMGNNKKRILAELRDRYPFQANCFNRDFCNLVILSKIPLETTGSDVSWAGPPYMKARFGPEAGGLTVFLVHTIRFPHSRAQFRQITAMAGLIESTPGTKLVMGDFNATPFSRIVQSFEQRTNLKRLTNLPSWPSYVGLPQIAIDHIFVSHGLKAVESQTIGEPGGSDHFPIALRIAVPLKP